MNHTYFAVEEELIGEIAHGWHDMPPEDGTLDDISTIPITAFYIMLSSADAMFSSAEDLARWSKALLQGNVLSQSFLNQMLQFQPILIASHPGWEYGLGITSYEPSYLNCEESIGQGGGNPGYRAQMLYLPDHDIFITVMLNEENKECLTDVLQALSDTVLIH
ncbi:serine hydrolase domain-containing protein [Calditrichota bacterium]